MWAMAVIFCLQCSTRNCPRNGSQAGQRTAKKIACNNLVEPLPIGSTKQLQLRYLGHQVVLLLHEAVPFVLESFHFSIFLSQFGQQNHDVRLGLAPPDLSPTVRLHVPLRHASAIDVVSVAIRLDLKDISAIVTMPALFPAPFKCIIYILAATCQSSFSPSALARNSHRSSKSVSFCPSVSSFSS